MGFISTYVDKGIEKGPTSRKIGVRVQIFISKIWKSLPAVSPAPMPTTSIEEPTTLSSSSSFEVQFTESGPSVTTPPKNTLDISHTPSHKTANPMDGNTDTQSHPPPLNLKHNLIIR